MEIIPLSRSDISKLGFILYKIREKRNVQQKIVAKAMGRVQTQVSGMENNRKVPGLTLLTNYLQAVGCKLAIIMEEKEDDGSQESPQ